MKKVIAILGIAAMVTACGSKTETTATAADSTAVSVDSTATVSDSTAVDSVSAQ